MLLFRMKYQYDEDRGWRWIHVAEVPKKDEAMDKSKDHKFPRPVVQS